MALGSLPKVDLRVKLGPVLCQGPTCKMSAELYEANKSKVSAVVEGAGSGAKATVKDFIARLLKKLEGIDQRRQWKSPLIRVHLKNPPEGMKETVRDSLKGICTGIGMRNLEDAQGQADLEIRCYVDSLELKVLLDKTMGGVKHKWLEVSETKMMVKFL